MPEDFEAKLDALLTVEPRVTWGPKPPASHGSWGDVWTIRILIAGGCAALLAFLIWFSTGDRIGDPWLFWPLSAVFAYGFAFMLYEWFCYLGIRPRSEPPPPGKRSVDILTTWVPGEPRDMVVSTLKAVQRIRYPHTTYLCDEGDDPLMRAVCERLGVRHVTRLEKAGAKAGNINNALKQATGEIAVILDPDHEPAPFFLERVLGYFDDPKVGFVQCVQGYYNQSESLVARGAAEQTYHFYGPVMTGMHGHGTTQAIGANCAFRRAALDSIGGHATGLAEDMATTLKIYAKGWTSVYVPETLTRGLVPNTMAAYAKQQLKWACGVWDILIESLPAAWPTLDWKNRVHILHNGLFYLRGLIVPLAILIPILALVTGLPPWRITMLEFVAWFGPLIAAQILIRQTAQRWLMEPSEYGFHFIGGFLMYATWWVHLAGATSAMRRVRILYIPTPKDDEPADAWGLMAPNLVLAAASLFAVGYGLWWDYSPFALLMAAFALTNALILGFMSLAAQQKTLARLRNAAGSRSPRQHHDAGPAAGLYWLLRRQSLVLAALIAAVGVAALAAGTENETPLERMWAQMEARTKKETGGFLLGYYAPALDKAARGLMPAKDAIADVRASEKTLGTDFSMVSLYHWWGDKALDAFPRDELEAIRGMGAVPMITWGPSLSDFSWAAGFEETAANRGIFRLILEGRLDYFLKAYAEKIRDYGGPVLMRFAHEMDNPQYPWSARGGNTPQEFIAAWRYVVKYFDGVGATNAAWVWNPWKPEAMRAYYPGDAYVDWVGLTLLNFGSAHGDGSWETFETLYAPFEAWIKGRGKPVLLAEFGSTALSGDQTAWIADALSQIAKRDEIRGAVFFDTDRDTNIPPDWENAGEGAVFDWSIDSAAPEIGRALAQLAESRPLYQPAAPAATPEPLGPNRIARKGEGWTLMDGDAPFLIKGVVYGAGQGWRVSEDPTRARVERDFDAIAAMGANTIRRYHPHWGDRNILRAAEAHGLKVLAGFSLTPEIDYVHDTRALARIEADVVEMVRDHLGEPTILMWMIGNETWGMMKHEYAKPYLTENRQAYLHFVDRLARRIKEIDPVRPVGTALEVGGELHGALRELSQLAPDVDVIGINAYYAEDLARLQSAIQAFGGERPWFLSEFGPDGYWDVDKTRWSPNGFPLEPTDAKKATQYADRWQHYVEDLRPFSVGGVAFTWRDRFEGSPTWFGITDMKGRRKPAYFALEAKWRDHPAASPVMAQGFSVAAEEAERPDATLNVDVRADSWPDNCRVDIVISDAMMYDVVSRWTRACNNAQYRLESPDRAGRYWISGYAITEDGAASTSSTSSAPLLVEDAEMTD